MGISHVGPAENVLLILGEVTKRERKVEFHQLLGNQVIGTVDEVVSDEGAGICESAVGEKTGLSLSLFQNTPHVEPASTMMGG